MNNQWHDNLRYRMERHQESAPEGLWDGIEQIISAESAAKTMPVARKIPLWGQRAGAVAAAAIILFFIGLFTWKENQKNTQIAEQVQHEQPVSATRPDEKETVVKSEKQPFVHNTGAGTPESKKSSRTAETRMLVAMGETGKTTEENELQPPGNEATVPDETKDRHPVNNDQQQPGLGNNNTPGFQLPVHRRHRKRTKWQTDVYAANIPSGITREHVGYGSLSPYKFPSEEEEYLLAAAVRSDSPNDSPELNEYQHVYTDIKHFQPIMLGVSMKYNFDEKWSVTSGLTYTVLSSQLRSGNDNQYYNSQQTLHYVGIPLNVNYAVWGNDKISTYVSGGGLVEKSIYGSLSTDYVANNKTERVDRQEISVKQLQWSVNSAVGIQYQFSKNIGIYAEPGVAYHFKNNSEVETIYKEKPLNFNIRLGLRFSLNE
jgi:Anti-sigma-K factor rskA.